MRPPTRGDRFPGPPLDRHPNRPSPVQGSRLTGPKRPGALNLRRIICARLCSRTCGPFLSCRHARVCDGRPGDHDRTRRERPSHHRRDGGVYAFVAAPLPVPPHPTPATAAPASAGSIGPVRTKPDPARRSHGCKPSGRINTGAVAKVDTSSHHSLRPLRYAKSRGRHLGSRQLFFVLLVRDRRRFELLFKPTRGVIDRDACASAPGYDEHDAFVSSV